MKRLIYAALAAGLLSGSALVVRARAEDEPAPPPESGAPAGGMDGHEGHHDKDDAGRMKGKLGLSDDQVKKFKDAAAARKEAVKPVHEKLKESLKKLRGQLKDKASDSDVQATLDSIEAARKEMRSADEKFRESLKSFLTSTQRAKLMLLHMRRMGPPMGRGRGRGPGRGHDEGMDKPGSQKPPEGGEEPGGEQDGPEGQND